MDTSNAYTGLPDTTAPSFSSPREIAKRQSDLASIARQRAAAKRRERTLALHVAGMTRCEIAQRLAVSERTVQRDLEALEDTRIEVDALIEDSSYDAHDVRVKLTQMLDADLADLFDESGSVKPLRLWPLVWRQGLAIEITEEDLSVRSSDGVQAGESKAWDKAGVRRKIKAFSRDKLIELVGRLKSVDAFVDRGPGAKEIAGEVMSEIDKRIAEGRERARHHSVALIETSTIDVDATVEEH